MPLFNAGVIIKELCVAQGFTHAKLAEGICSRDTVTKIINGKRRPEWFVFKNLMIRLGQMPDKYYSDIASENELYIVKKFNECAGYISAFNFDALKAELYKLENDKNFQRGGGKNYTCGLKPICTFRPPRILNIKTFPLPLSWLCNA